MESEEEGEAVTPVVASLPYYSAVPSMLANTDMVATLPERLAHRFANSGPYVVLDLSYEPTKVLIEAMWHERGEGDAGLQWLLGEPAGVVSER